MPKPDIQQVVGGLAQCILMRDRWAAGCLYLHETGDDDAAYEAMLQSDMWRDRGARIVEVATGGTEG